MDKDIEFEQALEKGNRFFARKNFALAKKHFEIAVKLKPDGDLLEKIKICNKENESRERNEDIKRGRKLEKKAKYREALQCFEKAHAQEKEEWLERKIASLKETIGHSEAWHGVRAAESLENIEARIAAYDKALELNQSKELLEKKANALVKLERYEEAIDLYNREAPSNDAVRYYSGYAYAKTGHFIKALEQWADIEKKETAFLEQYEALIPFVYKEFTISGKEYSYSIPYQGLHTLPVAQRSARLTAYEDYFRFKYIEELWFQGQYEAILNLLLPFPETLSTSLLGLYARVYFKLAERDVQQLEMAITFWLTAIYNDSILNTLYVHQLPDGNLDIKAIRERLLKSLEELVTRYEREDAIAKKALAYWALEKRIIQQLSMLPLKEVGIEIFPCTPGFAARFELAEPILTLLKEQRNSFDDEGEGYFAIGAYFSRAAQSLILMELGEEEKALSSLPKDTQEEISAYSQQRVFLRYGIKKALQGETQLKKYFLGALPLLKQYSRYSDELIELALSDIDLEASTGLAEAMEVLSHQIKTPKFLEATAHVMSQKAIGLSVKGVSETTVEKLLTRALRIYPESHFAQITLDKIRQHKNIDRLNSAFKKQNLTKAANIVNQSNDPELVDYFFETVEKWNDQVEAWDRDERLAALRDFYNNCYYVNKNHPLTIEINAKIKQLERR